MKVKIILISILILATFLRLINLGKIPNSYTPDELAQGYTAYSILNTGNDEWGSADWFNLRSFGDYKPPLQTLLMIPSIKLFGLNTFAVRFPNAVFSILTIYFTYLLANILFKNNRIALLSSFLMTVSPWFLPMSRIALEANLVVFFITSASFYFLLAAKNNKYFSFIISMILFSLSLFTYHSVKVFLPLYLIILVFYASIYKNKKFLITLIFSLFVMLIGIFLINHQVQTSRTVDISIINPTDNWQEVADTQYEISQNGLPYLITKIFFNKVTYIFNIFFHNYLSYFSPQFLITNGAGETTYGMLPGFGVLGIIPGIGLFYCLFFLLKNSSKNYSNLVFLFLSILVAPLAAAIAKGQYSANRVSLMMPFVQITASVGLVFLIDSLPSYLKKISTPILALALIYLSLSFLQKYFFQGNQILAKGMLYGHQQTNQYLQQFTNKQIIYSRKLSEPQAYVAFFNQINPKDFQTASQQWFKYQTNKLSFVDQLGEYYLNNYTFRELNIISDKELKNTILVGRPEEFLDTKPDYIVYYPSFSRLEPAIYIYITNK